MSERTQGTRTYDFVAVGLGPFNLGLACLADPVDDLDGVVLESRESFDWHPGMMLADATLQVPFMADLVTMADPTSPFSFLSYLKATGRLYPFYIRESFYPLRAEYNDYCRWAVDRLDSVHLGRHVEQVTWDETEQVYVVRARCAGSGDTQTYRGRRLVLGTGTQPAVPPAARGLDGPWLHSSAYLEHRDLLRSGDSITVVGGGQSAAEIYLDLLEGIDAGYSLTWLSRSPRFFPLEYTKLTLEMTSPEYLRYFHGLPGTQRDGLLRDQKGLYKGISGDLVDTIYDTLYRKRVALGDVPTTLLTNTELAGARWDGAGFELDLRQHELDESFGLRTEGLVLATGYAAQVPAFVEPVADRVRWDARGRYDVGLDYRVDEAGTIFVQNGEEHTHGLVAPDLGMGAYRSSVIINAMCGREVYSVEERIAFQEFGVPAGARRAVASR